MGLKRDNAEAFSTTSILKLIAKARGRGAIRQAKRTHPGPIDFNAATDGKQSDEVAPFCRVVELFLHSSHNQVRGHRTGSRHSGSEEYLRKKSQTRRWCTGHRLYNTAYAIHASASNIYKVKSGVSLPCARSILVHTSHYYSSVAPGKTNYTPLATHEILPRVQYTMRSNYHAFARQTQVNLKQNQKRKMKRNGNERKEKKKKEKKEEKRKKRKSKRDKERKQGKENTKNVILADRRGTD